MNKKRKKSKKLRPVKHIALSATFADRAKKFSLSAAVACQVCAVYSDSVTSALYPKLHVAIANIHLDTSRLAMCSQFWSADRCALFDFTLFICKNVK